uniref:N/A n=1 Tax=Ganoderma boninense TaxID=34458 RepID=A0A5K1JW22_9APHY|nr:N/A [Ganoderma boninense]
MSHVLQRCNTTTLTRCAASCQSFQYLVAAELRRRYFTTLRWFFSNRAEDFDHLLTTHRGIISGSTALAFLAWTDSWDPGDMDIYVPEGSYTEFVAALELSQLASLDHAFHLQPRSAYTGIKCVRRYVAPTGKHLDVIQSSTANAMNPLLYFWTSVVCNILSPHGAICGFPSYTLNDRALVEDIPSSDKLTLARGKYEARGYEFTRVDSWGPSSDVDSNGNPVFSDHPIMVLDFRTVYRTGPLALPVTRTGHLWVLQQDACNATSPM